MKAFKKVRGGKRKEVNINQGKKGLENVGDIGWNENKILY